MKIAPIFTTISSLNSHDWKELACRGILKFCYRGMLGERQEKSLFQFFDCVARLFAEIHNLQDLNQLEGDLNESLALLERDFPVEIQNITQHLLHHLVDGIRRFGPLYSTWMFGFERLNGWCSQRAVNKRHPESTIIETYLLYDFSQFLAATGIKSKTYLEGSGETLSEKNGSSSKHISLTKAILDDIFEFYCKKINSLNSLWDLYVAERKKMTKNSVVSFHEWEPRGRILTQRERFLTQPLNPSAKSMATYHLENVNNIRTVTFATDISATESSNSSIVCLNPNDSVPSEFKFGKILKIFEHTGYDMNYVFCLVELINTIYDNTTGLRKCRDFSGTTRRVVEINTCDEDWSWILF